MTDEETLQPDAPEAVPEVVVVTGMSGAGRSTGGNVMEDHGWYVIDNLPVMLLPDLLRLSDSREDHVVPESEGARVGIVLDVRAQGFATLTSSIKRLRERGWRTHLVFLDATNEALVRRFESVRRPPPLQGQGRLLDAIQQEREVLADVRTSADNIVDTSGLNVHQLSRKITPLFRSDSRQRLRLAVLSFGFKYGAARRGLRPRHAVPAQPLLGARAAAAHRTRDPGLGVRPLAGGRAGVHRRG